MLTNSELAQELRTLGNLLLIEGADNFRARRYARLADTIEALSEDVDVLRRRGELTRIDGVGESTAAVLTEYIESGTSALRQATETNVPASLLDLLHAHLAVRVLDDDGECLPAWGVQFHPEAAKARIERAFEWGHISQEELDSFQREHDGAGILSSFASTVLNA